MSEQSFDWGMASCFEQECQITDSGANYGAISPWKVEVYVYPDFHDTSQAVWLWYNALAQRQHVHADVGVHESWMLSIERAWRFLTNRAGAMLSASNRICAYDASFVLLACAGECLCEGAPSSQPHLILKCLEILQRTLSDVAPGRNYMNQQWHLYLLWNYLRSAEDSEDVRVVRAFACDRGVALTSFPLHPQQWWSEEPQAKRGGHVCVETNCRRTFEHDFVSSWATEVIVCCSILCNHPQFPQWCEAIRARCMQQGALPRGIVDRNSDETPWNCTLLLALRLLGYVQSRIACCVSMLIQVWIVALLQECQKPQKQQNCYEPSCLKSAWQE
eukprot:TRINITY_DN1841_c0_g1_i2.p1 TRINITY_DN1841_c0_g1~~TRINITY_DN1841_c0_g1_i2.p1  ORF type:complete len:332 (-),score=28.61 TRINITY_DN1841_c0_g1_i2:285-1280(-)